MKKIFEGKKLLVLGTNTGSEDIVSYAKESGAYVVVTDYVNENDSLAKKMADESILISTADVESLTAYVKENNIHGVFAGISEFNLLKAMEVSERCGLSFYCNRKQWDSIEQKNLFRLNCENNQVPVPKTYFTGSKTDEWILSGLVYPVVLKPVDSCASLGVHICNDESELKKYEKDALQHSDSGTIIIEEYIEGDEFTAHYTIVNGKAYLSCIDNRYPIALNEGKVTTIPVARIFPSLFIDEYMKQVNEYMVGLCEGMQLENAILFIQGIYNKKANRFAIFEGGLRIAAEAPYRFISEINGFNSMHLLVDQILQNKTVYNGDDPYLSGMTCGIVSFVAKGGRVGRITGLETTIRSLDSVIRYENRYPVGSDTPNGDTLKQLMLRFVLICENREKMKQDIQYLNENIHVYDTDNNEMVLKFDPERLWDTK